MQIREPSHETNGSGSGIAEIFTNVRIEQTGDALVSVFQDGKIGRAACPYLGCLAPALPVLPRPRVTSPPCYLAPV